MELLNNFVAHLSLSRASVKNYKADIGQFIRWYENEFKTEFTPQAVTPQIIEIYEKFRTGSTSEESNATSEVSTFDESHLRRRNTTPGVELGPGETDKHLEGETENVSKRTFNRHKSSLRKFFSFLKTQGLVSFNPLEQLNAKPYTLNADLWYLKDFKNSLYENNKSHLTIRNYLNDLTQFKKWVEKVTASLRDRVIRGEAISTGDRFASLAMTNEFVEEYKNRLLEKGASPLSINRKLSSLRSYLKWINKEEVLATKKSAFADFGSSTKIGLSLDSHLLKTIPYEIKNVKDVEVAGFAPAEPWVRIQVPYSSTPASSFTLSESESPRQYSSIPPVRLLQKIFEGLSFVFDSAFIEPLSNAFEELDYRWWKVRGKKIFRNKDFTPGVCRRRNTTPGVENVPKEFYAPLAVSTQSFPVCKKILHHLKHTRPEWYTKYHSYTLTHYFHSAILIVFMSLIGFSLYNALNPNQQESGSVLGAISSSRVLSYSGKLTDSFNNPVTNPKLVRFGLYNSPSASGSALFWQEVILAEPDKNGNFSVLLGNSGMNGTPIANSVFSDNPSLWLGMTIENEEEAFPREPIATTALANDAKTVGGLSPITKSNAGTSNVLLALDSSGNLIMGESANPTFEATNGQFKISGKTLLLATNLGSSADVAIAPDGLGRIDLRKPLYNSTDNSVWVEASLSLLATSSALPALLLNQNSTGDLISASSSGIPKFVINNKGGAYFADSLNINSDQGEVVSLSSKGASESGIQAYQTFGDSNTKYFKVGLNAAVPSVTRTAFDIVNSNSSSLLTILPNGNVGIGVLNPSYQLHLASDSAAKPTSGAWTIVSDVRLKDNIQPFKDGLSILNKINPVSYILNGKAGTPNGAKGIGVIAQEVKDFIPYTISTFKAKLNSDDKNLTELFNFDQSALTFVLINAVKELSAKVETLQSTLNFQLLTFNSQRIVSPLAEVDQIHTNIISPLAGNSVTIHLGGDKMGSIRLRGVASQHLGGDRMGSIRLPGETDKHLEGENAGGENGGKLIIENATGSAVAVIDSFGNVYAEGSLSARSASFSGQLSASSLSAPSVQVSEASVAGTLRVKKLIADEVDNSSFASSSSELARILLAKQAVWQGESFNNLNANFATLTQGLIALGPTSLNDAAVAGQLSIGLPIGGLILADNTINILGRDLEIQPLKQGGVSFLAGLVRIDSDGNLKVEGNATVKGVLAANIISPLPNQDLIFHLGGDKMGSIRLPGETDKHLEGENAGGENDRKFVIQNASGSSVLAIDQTGNVNASGSGSFTDILTKGLTIVRSAQADTSMTQTLATASAGTAVIIQGETERTIITPYVSEKSLIYLSPASDTQGFAPYIARQKDRSFTIQIPQRLNKDIIVNWWIVN